MSKLLRGVTAQLLLLTVLPLTLILAVISFGSIATHQQAMRRMVSERDIRAVTATANAIGREIQHRAEVLESLAANTSALTTTLAGNLAREFPGGVALYSADGALLAHTAAATWAVPPPISVSELAATGVQPVAWSGHLLLHARSPDQDIIALGALPVSALQFEAFVNPTSAGAAVQQDSVQGDGHSTGHPVSAFLFDSQGRVLAHSGLDEVGDDVRAHPGVAEALRGERGGLFQHDPASGAEHVFSFAPVVTAQGLTGLGVIIEEPWQAVVDPLMDYSLVMPLITLPVLLLAMLAVMFGLRRIVQPLQQLEQQTREIGKGNDGVLAQPIQGIDEVVQLQATLRDMAARIRADQERLRNYAHAVTETQEVERQRLARELHDDTIQSLIVLSQRIQSLRLTLPSNQPQVAARLDDLRGAVLQMIEDVRRFSRALRPIYLEDAGLVAALDRLMCGTNETLAQQPEGATRAATFSTNGLVQRFKPEVELALFRVAQEALANAVRHAHATQINLNAEGLPHGGVRLCIEDNGHGFDPANPPRRPNDANLPGVTGGGFGLLGIQERAMLIGAQVELSGAPGQGTRVVVTYQPSN